MIRFWPTLNGRQKIVLKVQQVQLIDLATIVWRNPGDQLLVTQTNFSSTVKSVIVYKRFDPMGRLSQFGIDYFFRFDQ